MATASKPNPFEKLSKTAAAASEVAEDETVEADEAAAPAVDAAPEAAPEVEEEEVDEEEEDDTPLALAADVAEEAPKPKTTRRTAKQVEEEAAKREATLEAQIEELRKALIGKADVGTLDIGIVQDKVVLEDGVGGDVRVVGAGKTLVNDDWRCTADGLRLILGRSSMQSTQQFHIPLSLVASLAELLSNVTEIQD